MRRQGAVLWLGLGLAVATGCAGGLRPEVLQAWVGQPAAALEREWGPPTRHVQDGEQRILIYEELETTTRRDFGSPTGGGSRYGMDRLSTAQALANEAYRPPTVYVRSYLFWVNREGTIVHSSVHQP